MSTSKDAMFEQMDAERRANFFRHRDECARFYGVHPVTVTIEDVDQYLSDRNAMEDADALD